MVIIDPGHGGPRNGTTAGGIIEKEITLDIAKQVRARCPWVALTRETDHHLTQRQRGAVSYALGASMVISLHVDSRAKDPDASGLVCYHYPGSGRAIEVARHIAAHAPIQLHNDDPVVATSPDDWRKRAHVVVCSHVAPTVLVEMFFATNPGDVLCAMDPIVREELIDAICEGVKVADPRH